MQVISDALLLTILDSPETYPHPLSHRDHIRLAWLVLRRGSLAEAVTVIPPSLASFAASRGKPETYHETITWAYLAMINERMHEFEAESFDEFIGRFPELLDHAGVGLGQYYSKAQLDSTLSRKIFLLPDMRVQSS